MISFPLRNLGAGEQWGRAVQDELQALDRDIAQLRNSQALTDSTQNTQLASLIYKQQQLQEQQDAVVTAQQRISESTYVVPRTSTFTKVSVGASNGQVAEYSETFTKPTWATFAIVSSISSGLVASMVPDTGSSEEPEVSCYIFASNTAIPDTIDFNNWRVVWYLSPYDQSGTYQNFAVSLPGDTLYIKQRVTYLATSAASVNASQAIVIQWV